MEISTLTNEELLVEFALQNLQICKLEERIAQLVALREKLASHRDANYKIYEDRLRQAGQEITMPKPENIDELLRD